MNIVRTEIPEVILLEPKIFKDDRGYFFESYNQKTFEEKVCKTQFIQDNEAYSTYGVLRGLHYQLPPYAQAKLVRVITGKVLDVAVDIRKESSTFGKHVSIELSDENKRQLFIPTGFAHGYVVLSEYAIFSYKVDNEYAPDYERGIKYDDAYLEIDWNINSKKIILSEKDKLNKEFREVELFKDKSY